MKLRGRISGYFEREKKMLKIWGLSIEENQSHLYFIYSVVLNFTFIFLYTVLDFVECFKHNFEDLSDIMVYASAGIASTVKTLVIVLNRKAFLNLLNKFEQRPFLPNTNRGGNTEEDIIRECTWITTAQTTTYWIFGTISIVGATTYSFINRFMHSDYHHWEFTYGKFTFLNVTQSPNFEISLAYQCFSMMTIASHFITIDLISASVLAHISYQFKVLQNNFRRIVENSYRDMIRETKMIHIPDVTALKIDGSEVPWKYLKRSLKKAVHYHCSIIEIAQEMERIFSPLLLFVFLGTLTQLGFLIYGTSTLTDPIKLGRMFGEIVSFSLQVATVCYWGERVMHESVEVGTAAYESNFVGTDLRFQKGLAFVIRRSNRPVKLTAGKFTDICIASFTWIERTSYSTYMVLRRTNN